MISCAHRYPAGTLKPFCLIQFSSTQATRPLDYYRIISWRAWYLPFGGGNARSLIFGHERITPALGSNFKPIQENEIEREVQVYKAYIDSFSRDEALKRPITYAVIPVERNFDFTNLDRWYERDAGERVGDYTLYRLKLRP